MGDAAAPRSGWAVIDEVFATTGGDLATSEVEAAANDGGFATAEISEAAWADFDVAPPEDDEASRTDGGYATADCESSVSATMRAAWNCILWCLPDLSFRESE